MSARPAIVLGAALVTVVLWASAFVGIRAAGDSLSPGPLALARLLIGMAVLGVFVLARRETLPHRRELPLIALCGALWFGAYNVALNSAERRLDAGTAAMLVNVGPVLVAVLAGLILNEGFPRQLLVGCLIAFAGVAVIAAATAHAGLSTLGAALAVLAAAAYAGGVVAQKLALRRISPLQTTFLRCCFGALVCLPFVASLQSELRDADSSAIAWAIYLGVLPTGLAFTLWAFALARSTAGRLAVTTYLVPPISIALGWIVLGESPPGLAYVGGSFCLLGVVVARR